MSTWLRYNSTSKLIEYSTNGGGSFATMPMSASQITDGNLAYARMPTGTGTWSAGSGVPRIENSAVNYALEINSTHADGGSIRVMRSGTSIGYVGSGASISGSYSNNDFFISSVGNKLRLRSGVSGGILFGDNSAYVTVVSGPGAVSLGDESTRTLGTTGALQGLLVVVTPEFPFSALFIISSTTVTLISAPSGWYSVTAGTGSSTNVYVSGGNVIMQNRTGGQKGYYVVNIGGNLSS